HAVGPRPWGQGFDTESRGISGGYGATRAQRGRGPTVHSERVADQARGSEANSIVFELVDEVVSPVLVDTLVLAVLVEARVVGNAKAGAEVEQQRDAVLPDPVPA